MSSSKVTYPDLDKLTYPTSDFKEVLAKGLFRFYFLSTSNKKLVKTKNICNFSKIMK